MNSKQEEKLKLLAGELNRDIKTGTGGAPQILKGNHGEVNIETPRDRLGMWISECCWQERSFGFQF